MAEGRSLGEAIRLRRLDLEMSQEELAERIGPDVRQSDVSRLERGKVHFPRLDRLNQIAAALGVSVGSLLVEGGWFSDREIAEAKTFTIAEPRINTPIIIADDEPVSLDAIESLLDNCGYRTATAYDVASLKQAIDLSSPEVVIVDIALPGLKPAALVEQMARRATAPTLVFMGAGFPDVEMDGPYLEKPIDARQLFACISSIEKRRPLGAIESSGNGHRSVI